MESKPAAKGLRERERERHKWGSDFSATESTKSKVLKVHPQVLAAQVKDVLTLLLVFRFINALCVRTFFQPDEYFQALEPAWSIAFGPDSGAWLTWEWQHQLRSSLHPAILGLAYKAVDGAMGFLNLFPPFRAFILVALPGVLQSVFAALSDFYTWKLAIDIYGRESNAPWAALSMSVLNPWQWYCSTRTFSNSLENTLTIAALAYWPWEVLAGTRAYKGAPLQGKGRVTSLRVALVLAAVAVLLRPTNLLVWLAVLGLSLARLTLTGGSPWNSSTLVLFREIVVCGTAVLAVSLVSDRLYFGFWTFPPYKWLYFNISQSLAVFYGHMPWHYYLSQGIPLLTTTFLPFALVGLYKAAPPLKNSASLQCSIMGTLSAAVLTMVTTLSLISHKEVRFIYPLLPILHILAAPYIIAFFTQPTTATTTTTTTTPSQQSLTSPVTLRHKRTLANLLSLNLLLAGYLSLFHQPAPLSVLTFLRTEFERLHPDALHFRPQDHHHNNKEKEQKELFALFLTPCHSTPWRSHLVYPALRARALTCEPPLHTAPGSREREAYLDEADRFYHRRDDGREYGVRFLADEMWPFSSSSSSSSSLMVGMTTLDKEMEMGKRKEEREERENGGGEIPRYIVGFEGIEPVLQSFFGQEQGQEQEQGDDDAAAAPGRGMGVRLTRVWSAWNGAFNEDWRRRGRLVVWDTGVYEGSGSHEGEGKLS
ncbi:glycosyltransferase family 22 protein [Parathielavia hyrcaniae]|uniref:Mannosyltransferase n=1 Tax=Parathielavia hyrcaniae TaxID=113614 RepID=A0AAN6T6M9_9PEZI|nr:glycosyltransferase family 22 protein [Parathielavia hyrcaniae]